MLFNGVFSYGLDRKVLACVIWGRLKSAFQIASRSESVSDVQYVAHVVSTWWILVTLIWIIHPSQGSPLASSWSIEIPSKSRALVGSSRTFLMSFLMNEFWDKGCVLSCFLSSHWLQTSLCPALVHSDLLVDVVTAGTAVRLSCSAGYVQAVVGITLSFDLSVGMHMNWVIPIRTCTSWAPKSKVTGVDYIPSKETKFQPDNLSWSNQAIWSSPKE
jgi:hypothetical protein